MVYPSPKVLIRRTRHLDPKFGLGGAISTPFQNAFDPFSAGPFFEAVFFQVTGPGGLAFGRRVLFFRPLLKPGPQLRLFRLIGIEAGDPLSDHDQAVEHLDGEVPGGGDPGKPSLRLEP